jgi:hypothetical protein
MTVMLLNYCRPFGTGIDKRVATVVVVMMMVTIMMMMMITHQ